MEPTSLHRHRLLICLLALNCMVAILFIKPVTWLPSLYLQEDWRDFAHDYRNRFQRSPPLGMEKWLQHAQEQSCETRDFYESLDRDLEYFRGRDLQWDRVIPEGIQWTDHYAAFSLENHDLKAVEYRGPQHQRKPILRLIRQLMKPVIKHSPPLKSKFVFNLHDTAKEASVHATYPLFSVCKMDYYTDNQWPPSTKNNGTASVNSTYTLGPNFAASKDLIVPWWFSLRFQSVHLWFWPFYGSGFPFRHRRDAITWRGSTTSEWETGPRFQLVRNYGSPGIHRLHDNRTQTDVDADFAFIKVVQKPGEVALTPGYRFARHMFYWEMQLRKYIMDVDGNGFTSRFPGLLRSGSLVFKSTRYREWFHGILVPFQDYIPVNYDLSDLAEKVAWAQANPRASERIVKQSRENVETRLRVEDMQCYMYRLMLEYQTLFEKQETLRGED